MSLNLTQKLIQASRVVDPIIEAQSPPAQKEIGLKVDQVLLQDVLGILVMLELEAMGVQRSQVETAVQYVDHNLVQSDNLNAEEHLFLRSACRRYGIWYSRAGNGISHPTHMARFGVPGKVLVGSDSHTPAAGALGMLAIGAGGLEIALALAGKPVQIQAPKVWGVKLSGSLPKWTSAKDVILEMLRRHGVEGGSGYVLEYYGPGLKELSVMDRHVIANMGAEMGATSSVFPSDDVTRRFLRSQQRDYDWRAIRADDRAEYDAYEEIDLSNIEPLIALPSSPDNIVPVSEVAGEPIHQSYLGSSANPGYRDFAIAAHIVRGQRVDDKVSLDVNPGTRQVLADLIDTGKLTDLVQAGARIHQAGCNGCIGMGQAPAAGKNSLRTVPRNFPGRSGTREDRVFLCSPETAAASALNGVITDPRTLPIDYPRILEPEKSNLAGQLFLHPLPEDEAKRVELAKSENIDSIPSMDEFPEKINVPIILKVSNDISTDDIIPAGTIVMPLWSHISKVSDFVFAPVDASYPERARQTRAMGGHAIVAGTNYGQGSSRENAAIAPRHLGLRVVVAKSFARIHWQNLANSGVLALTFADPNIFDHLSEGESIELKELRQQLKREDRELVALAHTASGAVQIRLKHELSPRQIEYVLAGGIINWIKRDAGSDASHAEVAT